MTDYSNTGNALLNSDEDHNGNLAKDQGKAENSDQEMDLIEEAKLAADNPEKWLDYCKELVFEYRKLMQQGKSNYYKKDGDVGYLLSMKWLDEWKRIVYYESFYRNMKPEYDPEKTKEIPPISNDELIMEKDSFYMDVDPNSYYNFILRPNIKMNVDYKPVDEDTWKFFHSRYGGTEIKRFYYKTYSFGADIEAKLKEYKVVILPPLESWDRSKITNPKSIFVSKHDTFNKLLERLENILNSEKYNMNISQDRMRAWKLAYNADINKVDQEIRSALDSKMDVEDTDEDSKDSSGKKIEKNLGVRFPGTSLEMMKKFDIDDIELSSNDTLVIETADPSTKKFIFYFEKIEILGYGKCEYCYSHKPLVVQCR